MKISYEEGHKTNKVKKIKWIIIVIILVLFLFWGMFFGGVPKNIFLGTPPKNISKNSDKVEAQRLAISTTDSNEIIDMNNISQMLENSMKSVVGISKLKDNGNSVFLTDGVNKMGIGSGLIVSEKGYILTNEHVSGSKGSTCYITMEDGKQYNAVVAWSDTDLDLSILRVNMKFIDVAILGDSDSVLVGDVVYAIGNPIGFEFQKTVTSGIVSATNRALVFKENDKDIYYSNLIQTDATINPGNSGGPLININGAVIGINTVKITSADGMGFAIPINVVKPIIERFENDGQFDEAAIGIFAYDKNVIPYINTNLKFDTGIYVAQISLDSPAYRSGLEIGDVIVKIDDVELDKMCDLREYIYKKNVGDRVKLTVLKGRRMVELECELNRKK